MEMNPEQNPHFKPSERIPFVGRQKQLEQLNQVFDNTQKGNGTFLLVTGKSGIGKSRLVDEFIANASHKSCLVSKINIGLAKPYDPYRPFLEFVTSQSLNKGIFAASNDDLTFAADKNSDSEKLFNLQSNQKILQQRIVSALFEIIQNQTLIVVLDDIYKAPLATWQFIHYLSGCIIDKKVLLIATLRQDGKEISPSKIPVYVDILQRMNRERLLTKITLGKFSHTEVKQLIYRYLNKTDLSYTFNYLLYEVSGGIPGTVVKLLEQCIKDNFLYQENNIWYDHNSITKDVLINYLHQNSDEKYYTDLLNNSSDTQKEILKYAALFQNNIPLPVLQKLIGVSRINFLREFSPLEMRRTLEDDGNSVYRFSQLALAKFLCDQLSAQEKRHRHLQIANAIQESESLNEQERALLLAYHYDCAEDTENAFKYLFESGNILFENFDYINALYAFNKALSLSAKVNQADKNTLTKILLNLILLNRILGNPRKSLTHCFACLELSLNLDDQFTKYLVLTQMGLTYFNLQEWEKAKKCFKQTISSAQRIPTHLHAMANYGLGNVYLENSEFINAKTCYKTALELLENDANLTLKANIYNNMGIIENILGNRLKAIALYSKCIPIYQKLEDKIGLARVYTNIGISYADEKLWEKANEFYSKSLQVCDTMGFLQIKATTFINRASALIYLNRLEEAREYNTKAFKVYERLKDHLGLAEYYKIQGIIDRATDNINDAVKHFSTSLEIFMSVENKLGIAETKLELGKLYLQNNDFDSATRWLEEAKAIYHELNINDKYTEIEQMIDHCKNGIIQ
jgi:tetratricopeptide (TPR) repeat protein/nucleoside-triphosphatase THEP1